MNPLPFLSHTLNDTMKEVMTLIIEAVQQIVVLQGNNPNYVKLTQALVKVNNLLR